VTDLSGTWNVAGKDVDDTWVRYRPLFSDMQAQPGNAYYYRVRARNAAGSSTPSNVVGPVRVSERYIIDEMIDFSRIFAHEGNLTLETANARPYKEDPHRLKGQAGDSVTYQTVDPLGSAKVLTFGEASTIDLDFYISRDGQTFTKVIPKINRFPSEVNLYGYKVPTKYEFTAFPTNNYFLKIVFRGAAQISRVEVRYGK
jgi:hypothetical protein